MPPQPAITFPKIPKGHLQLLGPGLVGTGLQTRTALLQSPITLSRVAACVMHVFDKIVRHVMQYLYMYQHADKGRMPSASV